MRGQAAAGYLRLNAFRISNNAYKLISGDSSVLHRPPIAGPRTTIRIITRQCVDRPDFLGFLLICNASMASSDIFPVNFGRRSRFRVPSNTTSPFSKSSSRIRPVNYTTGHSAKAAENLQSAAINLNEV